MVARSRIRAFTPVEVLAVALLCLFLLVVLPPVVHMQGGTHRMPCGVKLSGIGKAMLIYANDYEDELPRAGGPATQWTGRTPDWAAENRYSAFGLASDGTGGEASIGASLYLLVKYVEVKPEFFVCPGANARDEKALSEFEPKRYRVGNRKLPDFWDFGPDPTRHVSYAYQMVYGSHRLTTSGESGLAIAADGNPWMASQSGEAKDFSRFQPELPPFNGTSEQARFGNSVLHGGDGQNVLFLDSHVEFAKLPYCGHEEDNIYTSWDGKDRIRGLPPRLGSMPAHEHDSLLVNDPAIRSD